MNRLDRLCEAIMWREGWRPSSRSYRNCNPGNLRWSRLQAAEIDGYAAFKTLAEGWEALVSDVRSKAMGKTRTPLGPSSSILEFVKVYAPSGDANEPELYCRDICNRARLDASDTLGSLLANE